MHELHVITVFNIYIYIYIFVIFQKIYDILFYILWGIYIYIYIYVYMYMYICICIYVYVYTYDMIWYMIYVCSHVLKITFLLWGLSNCSRWSTHWWVEGGLGPKIWDLNLNRPSSNRSNRSNRSSNYDYNYTTHANYTTPHRTTLRYATLHYTTLH